MTTGGQDEKAWAQQDSDLLRRYIRGDSQEAFSGLVQRYLRLVYTTCLREVRDPDLAQDVTQVVFLVLSQKARALHARTSLAGWLFETARLASQNALRKERRRMIYEQQAARESVQSLPDRSDLWDRIEPLLNEGLSTLRPPEREAVLLRFFQDKSFKEIGTALGLSEDAARMRVSRTLEKLRRHLCKHGVVLSAATLLGLLSARATLAAPATCLHAIQNISSGLAAGQAPSLIAGSFLDHLNKGVLRAMWMSKVQMPAMIAGMALIVLGGHPRIMAQRLSEAESRSIPLMADTRWDSPQMDRKVTIATEGMPVDDLLASLSKQTGVALKADSYIADDKVIAFSAARPLRDVLTDLAALFNDSWQQYKNDKGASLYVLHRSVRAKEYEDGLVNNLGNRMMTQLDERVRKLDVMPDALTRIAGEHFAVTAGRRAIALYACLSQEQRQQLFTNGRLNLTFDNLTPTQQARLRSVFTVMYEEEQAQFQRDKQDIPGLLDTTSKPEDVLKGGLRLGLLVSQRELIVRIGHHYTLNLMLDAPLREGVLPPHGNPYTGSKISGKAALPDIDSVHTASLQGSWPAILHKLADATGAPVMADYYRSRPVGDTNPEAAAPTKEATNARIVALDALCLPNQNLWWTRGNALLFRKRNWYTLRLYEVPDRWFLAMNQRLQAAGACPSYADILPLSELTPMQMRGLNSIPDRPEGTVIRPAADEYWLSGVPQLLSILKASGKSNTGPLPFHKEGTPYPPGLMDRFVLTEADCAPGLLQAYLAAQNDLIYAPDYSGFNFHMWRPLDTPQTAADGYRFVPVTLFCGIENKQAMFLDFLLPVTLPDDRRDKTRITVVP